MNKPRPHFWIGLAGSLLTLWASSLEMREHELEAFQRGAESARKLHLMPDHQGRPRGDVELAVERATGLDPFGGHQGNQPPGP